MAMSSGDNVIWPQPSGRTITECVHVCMRVYVCVSVSSWVHSPRGGDECNQECKSTILATASHMSDKMNGDPFPLQICG